MKRTMIIVALFTILLVLITGCSEEKENNDTPATNTDTEIESNTEASYDYDKDGFPGLSDFVNLNSNPTELLEIKLNGKTINAENDQYYSCKDITLFEKYTGDFGCFLDPYDYTKIKQLYFSFDDVEAMPQIIEDFNGILGDPIHYENYNDNNDTISAYAWIVNDDVLLSLEKNRLLGNASLEVIMEFVDHEAISNRESCKERISSDEELQKYVEEINKALEYDGKPINEVVEKTGAVFNSDKSTDEKYEFDVEGTFLGYEGYWSYYIYTKEETSFDNYAKYLGETNVSFGFIGLEEEDKEDILSIFDKLYGTDCREGEVFIECNFDPILSIDKQWKHVYFHKNNRAYKVDHEWGNDKSKDVIEAYEDVDIDVLISQNNNGDEEDSKDGVTGKVGARDSVGAFIYAYNAAMKKQGEDDYQIKAEDISSAGTIDIGNGLFIDFNINNYNSPVDSISCINLYSDGTTDSKDRYTNQMVSFLIALQTCEGWDDSQISSIVDYISGNGSEPNIEGWEINNYTVSDKLKIQISKIE